MPIKKYRKHTVRDIVHKFVGVCVVAYVPVYSDILYHCKCTLYKWRCVNLCVHAGYFFVHLKCRLWSVWDP